MPLKTPNEYVESIKRDFFGKFDPFKQVKGKAKEIYI